MVGLTVRGQMGLIENLEMGLFGYFGIIEFLFLLCSLDSLRIFLKGVYFTALPTQTIVTVA